MTDTVQFRRTNKGADNEEIVLRQNDWTDIALGNRGGRLRLRGYSGSVVNIAGGASVSSGNYAIDLQSASTKHFAAVHSGTSATAAPTAANSVVLIGDDGLVVGMGKYVRLYDAAGTDYAEVAADADGGVTVGGSGANAGLLTFKKLRILETAGTDYAEVTSSDGLLTLAGTGTDAGHVALTTVRIGATPALTGVIRMTNGTAITQRDGTNAGDLTLISANSANTVLVGVGSAVLHVGDNLTGTISRLQSAGDCRLRVGATDKLIVSATKTTLGAAGDTLAFFGGAGAAIGTAFTQTYATADPTLNAYTTAARNVAYTGIATGIGATPYAHVDDLNSLRTAYENLRAMCDDHVAFTNALVDKLQAYGQIG